MSVFRHESGPLVIAHRGARDVAPENTMAAFEAALSADADGIELDVSRCASGEIVVMHDDTVDRTTDGMGRIADLSWPELVALDAGAWFGEGFAGERIPLLKDVLAQFSQELMINIEIKAPARSSLRGDGIEAEIAEMVRRYRGRPVLISSFNPMALHRMRRATRDIPCGLLYAPNMPRWLAGAWSRHWLRLAALHPEHTMLDSEKMARLKGEGYQVNAWTVNEREEMWRLIELGVDALITDHPAQARELLPR